MIEILRKYAANGFADFRGLVISGQVPVKEQLINEVIAEVLQAGLPSGGPKTASDIDPKMFLGLVKKLELHADDGVVRVDFELRA